MADLNTLEDNLRSEFGPAVIAAQQMLGELTLIVSPDVLSRLMVFLRDNPKCRFTTLIDICGADYPSRAERFEVVYHLLSMHLNHRLRIKVRVGEGQVIDSVVPVWPAANWYEREAFDMYG
ncbi:MAG TPA: NADH-quinone oxidoreductase subunit C, partial [Alphaproteobacteria bacterium]|nr:NADH-quinone oxidoreductase subunit C [Alphaproteobacteria bacterium]